MGKFHLQLRVIEAVDIPAADLGGYSDPYCCIQVGYEYRWAPKVHKTRIIGKSLHPVWNEVFALEADNPDKDRVRMIVYDHDLIGKDDALGEANLHLAQLLMGVEQDLWLPLSQAGKARGKIHVTVKPLDFGKPAPVQQVTTVTQQQGYGAPAPGYGAPAPGYGAPAPGGYPAPAPGGYPAPAPGGYPAPAPGGYPAPAPGGYPAPAPGGYPAPAPGYGAPAPGYGAPAPGYGAPAPGYGAPAPGYGAPAPGYGAPAPGYGAPPPATRTTSYTTVQYGAPAPAPAYGYAQPAPVVVHHGKPKKYKYKMKLGKALGFKKFKW